MNDSEANLWEVFMGNVDIANATMSILITVIFAFLVAIFLVGGRLTRTQLVIIAGVYSIFFLLMLQGLFNQLLRAAVFAGEIEQANPARDIGLNSSLATAVSCAFLIFYLSSVIFMIQIRRNAKKNLEQA